MRAHAAILGLLLVVLGSSGTPRAIPATASYTITDLGALVPGASYTFASSVNDFGHVVGSAALDTGEQAFLIKDGVVTLLGNLGAAGSSANAVNDSGQVIGYSSVSDTSFVQRAFFYEGNGPIEDLGTLADGTPHGLAATSFGTDVNDSGVAVGWSTTAAGANGSFIYTRATDTMSEVGPVPVGFSSLSAGGINAAGRIVGTMRVTATGARRAFLYNAAAVPKVTNLGIPTNGFSSQAEDINDQDVIVGSITVPGSPTVSHAAVFQNGQIIDLQTLPGHTFSGALAINNTGVIVGASATAGGGTYHAMVYDLSTSGPMLDLNDLIPAASGWTLEEAWDINDAGQIVGYGVLNGEYHAFLLTPNGATTKGTNVVVAPVDDSSSASPVQLTFENITAAGSTTLSISTNGPTPPDNFQAGSPAVYYDITTTAAFTGNVTVCLNYAGITFSGAPALFHYENGTWVDITQSLDAVNQVVCGVTSSLSPFAIFSSARVNLPPTASAGGPYQVGEGGSLVLAGSGSDPEGSTLLYAWDLDNNETFETPGQNVTFSAAALDGPSTYRVAVQVTDSGGLAAVASTTITVVNAPPIIGTLSLSPNPVVVGASVQAAASFSDAGTLDQHTATWVWGDGTSEVRAVSQPLASAAHVYQTVGVHSVRISVTDSVDTGSKTTDVTVVYRICPLYNTERAVRSGSTVSIKLQICDAAGVNVSSAAIPLHAVGIALSSAQAAGAVEDPGYSNPDLNFRYDATLEGGGYVFNLSTVGLTTGTYALHFTAGGAAFRYTALFQVR